jgi:uncharacterized membrane protein
MSRTPKDVPVEQHHRSVTKAISYRVLSLSVDAVVAYFFTQDVMFSAGIVVLVNGYSTILYYLHERAWANIRWGRD